MGAFETGRKTICPEGQFTDYTANRHFGKKSGELRKISHKRPFPGDGHPYSKRCTSIPYGHAVSRKAPLLAKLAFIQKYPVMDILAAEAIVH